MKQKTEKRSEEDKKYQSKSRSIQIRICIQVQPVRKTSNRVSPLFRVQPMKSDPRSFRLCIIVLQ